MERTATALLLALLFPPLVARAAEEETEATRQVERLTGPVPEELTAWEDASRRFAARMGEFRTDTREYIALVERMKRTQAMEGYGRIIASLREDEEALTTLAKTRFEAFLEKYPDVEYSPHIMFRLAELYFEEAENAFLADQREYDLRVQELPPEQLDQLPAPPRKDYLRPLELYNTIVSRYPAYERMDGVHYMLGYCYTEENGAQQDLDRGLAALTTLVERYPDSEFLNDASMRLGEHFFGINETDQAIVHYQRIVDSGPKARYYDKGLYKLAWAHYRLANGERLEEYGKALSLFTSLMDHSRHLMLATGEKSPMEKEAIQYMAISFADAADHRKMSPVDVAERFFQEVGEREYEWEVFKELAETLTRQARFPEAIATYRYLQDRWPLRPENPEFQHTVARIFMSLPVPDEEASSRAQLQLAERYYDGSEWWNANRNNPDALATVRRHIEKSLASVAYNFHERAQRTGSVEDYSAAADKYREYVTKFPFADDYYDMEWYLADALFNAGRMEEAEREYLQLLKTPNHGYGDGSLWRLMLARRQILIDTYGKVEALPDDAMVEKVAQTEFGGEYSVYMLSDRHRLFIEACDSIVEADFADPAFADARARELAALRYLPAQILVEHGRHAEARERFHEIIKLHPDKKEAAFSAAFIVGTYQDEKDLENVRRWSGIFGRQPLGPPQVDVPADFEDLEQGAAFTIAVNYAKDGKYAEAADAFQAFLKDFPRSKHEADARFNAALNLERTGKLDEANTLFEDFINRFPNDERSEAFYLRIGDNYADILELGKAITYYQALAENFPKSENAPIALSNAAFLKVGMGDHRGAADGFERYATRYPEQADAEKTFYRAGEEWELVSPEAALAFYGRYLQRYPGVDPDHEIQVRYRTIQILIAQGKQRLADREWEALLAAYDRHAAQKPLGPDARRYAAEGEFRAIWAALEQFQQIRYTGDQDRDAELLVTQKIEELEALKARCLLLVQKYQDFTYTSATLYVQAAAHFAYADMLFNAPPPKGFSQEMIDIYVGKLDEIRVPIEEKGKGLALANLEKARAEESWSEWQVETLRLLNRRMPSEYPREKMEAHYTTPAWVLPEAGPMTVDVAKDEPSGDAAGSSGEEGP